MGKIVVEVMPKDEILDPQGKAIVNALKRMDIDDFVGARQGKRFILETEGRVSSKNLENARIAAEKLLSNPVIESVIKVQEEVVEKTSKEESSTVSEKTDKILGNASSDLAKIIEATAIVKGEK